MEITKQWIYSESENVRFLVVNSRFFFHYQVLSFLKKSASLILTLIHLNKGPQRLSQPFLSFYLSLHLLKGASYYIRCLTTV